MPTPARYVALRWFYDHEALGPDEVLRRKPPSARIRRLMVENGEVEKVPVGQFAFQKWVLTDKGREILNQKPPPRKRRSEADAKRRTTRRQPSA